MSTPTLSTFLGPRAAALIDGIEDARLREHVRLALEICADALATVDAFDLSSFEVTPLPSEDLSLWRALRPHVHSLLQAVKDAADRLRMLFPGGESSETPTPALDLDVQATVDLLDASPLPEPIRDNRGQDLDRIIERVHVDRQAILGESIAALASMLQEDFARFEKRLRSPHILRDRWNLLGELQELHSKCVECLEATAAALVQAFAEVEVEDLLPRYTSAALQAARIRGAVVDLSHDVARVKSAIAHLDRRKASVFHEYLVKRMDHFAQLPAYRKLRALDKKEFILFRMFLFNWGESEQSTLALRQQVEGFSKYLDMMRSINQRRELISHDRRYLKAAQIVLASTLEVTRARPYLELAYGRCSGLDEAIRSLRGNHPSDRQALREAVDGALVRLDHAASPY